MFDFIGDWSGVSGLLSKALIRLEALVIDRRRHGF